MGRVGVGDPALSHYCLEEIDHCLVVGHEPVLVLELVEENVLAVNPDVGVSNLPVDRDLSLNLVRWVVFCRAKVWFAELAVATATSHDLNKPVSRRSHNIRNLFQFGSTGNVDELWCAIEFYVVVDVLYDMVAFSNHRVIDSKSPRLFVFGFHLPSP